MSTEAEHSQFVRDFNAGSPITVACPKCGAAPLKRCKQPSGKDAGRMHSGRWSAKFQQEREAGLDV
jgi:hypothetical protein